MNAVEQKKKIRTVGIVTMCIKAAEIYMCSVSSHYNSPTYKFLQQQSHQIATAAELGKLDRVALFKTDSPVMNIFLFKSAPFLSCKWYKQIPVLPRGKSETLLE